MLDTHADGAAEGDRNGQFPQRLYSRRLGPSRPLLYRAESSIASITGLLNTVLFASRPMENCTCNQSPLGEVMGVSGARQKLLQLSVASFRTPLGPVVQNLLRQNSDRRPQAREDEHLMTIWAAGPHGFAARRMPMRSLASAKGAGLRDLVKKSPLCVAVAWYSTSSAASGSL